MHARRHVLSLILVVACAAAGVLGLTVLKARPKLGLDLRGGVSVVLTAKGRSSADVLDKTVDIIRERVNQLGTQEPEISRSGSDNIIVQLPGIKDPDRAVRIIGKTAQLRFRSVLEVKTEEEAKAAGWQLTPADPEDRDVFYKERDPKRGRWFHLGPPEVFGDQIKDAYATYDQRTSGGWTVQLEFNGEGARRFQQITGRLAPQGGNPGQLLAIVLDRVVESAPQVQSEIREGRAQISGTFTEREARDLGLVLKTGALPIELEQSQVVRVSPTLGKASLNAGLLAGAIGLALVMAYILLYYRMLGLVVIAGLAIFGALVLGLIGFIGAVRGFTLTLAGIAGIIVSIGIAGDSYIIYFERIKDELREGKTFRLAVDRAFSSALRTNFAANSVAFIAAMILYLLAVGPVRGFALTLGISAVFDILLLYFFTHPAVALIARNKRLAGLRAVGMGEALASAAG
jgi:protein-export membrane protein SecD